MVHWKYSSTRFVPWRFSVFIEWRNGSYLTPLSFITVGSLKGNEACSLRFQIEIVLGRGPNINNIIMLPGVDKNEELTAHLATNPIQNKLSPRGRVRVWDDSFQLMSISSPEVLDRPKTKKMFKLRFVYLDDKKKRRSHVVYFGDETDFIFTGDKQQRVKKILKMKNLNNPFHSDYWSAHLANKYATLKQGLEKFTEFFISSNNSKLQKKITDKMPKLIK